MIDILYGDFRTGCDNSAKFAKFYLMGLILNHWPILLMHAVELAETFLGLLFLRWVWFQNISNIRRGKLYMRLKVDHFSSIFIFHKTRFQKT